MVRRWGRLIFLILLVVPVASGAERINLSESESIDTPTATKMNWYIDHIDGKTDYMAVRYQWLTSNNTPIRNRDTFNSWQTWECRDIPTPGENAQCVGTADPFPCCTGAGAGTCDGLDDNCFSAIFRFNVRSQDVGTPIGVGLRTLIWNQMRQDVLSPGNNGAFE